ncbi:MAG: AzlD domain-containing protein [Gammaproteobacteria bacterium]|nr:MAG: AzlD domain-containing protein [Gammaproteobacteria bacterium]UCH39930.1 MAG: AzlD domain-containing protein [Gammaproteobacteria bacterium]
MPEQSAILAAIGIMALVVYLTRISGYFVGLQLRHIRGIQPILESLPGCAFMAILVPAIRQGSLSEIIAMACVVLIMWHSNNVVLATGTGVAVLLLGGPYLDAA